MAGKPKPTALKLIEGNRGKRRIPEEVKPRPVIPDCPRELDSGAKRFWKYLAPKIERLGLLTEVDGDTFAGVCQTRSRLMLIWKRLKRINLDIASLERQVRRLQKHPPSEDGIKQISSIVSQLEGLQGERAFFMKEERLYSNVFRMQAAEFGLTPRGRVGLVVAAAGSDEGSDLLTQT